MSGDGDVGGSPGGENTVEDVAVGAVQSRDVAAQQRLRRRAVREHGQDEARREFRSLGL